jgi:hypothetical protein
MTVTMKNVVFWDIKTQFVPHRRYITSPLMLCKILGFHGGDYEKCVFWMLCRVALVRTDISEEQR